MVYKNKAGQPRERAMVAAYSLVTKFGAKQKDVATVLGCSQATVANWVKEVGFQKEINGLQRELNDANEYIEELQHMLPPPEEDYIDGDYSEEDDY
ncbi:helix-turn-helix domain-containing protein [Gallaecimonas pentaromativorans]|nr:helix-turn-helix domain-containing protein [Gallaecimonas pentaromativorans]